MAMIKDDIFPFSFKGMTLNNDLYLVFKKCTFTEDFGKIQKGTYFDCVGISFGCGWITCWNDKSDEIIELGFKISYSR
jgi:hypothetical protein